jgi:hypothetical protein
MAASDEDYFAKILEQLGEDPTERLAQTWMTYLLILGPEAGQAWLDLVTEMHRLRRADPDAFAFVDEYMES